MYYITSANNQLLFFLPRMHNVHAGGMGGMILKQLFRDKRETYLKKYGGKNIGTAAAVPAVPLPPSLHWAQAYKIYGVSPYYTSSNISF